MQSGFCTTARQREREAEDQEMEVETLRSFVQQKNPLFHSHHFHHLLYRFFSLCCECDFFFMFSFFFGKREFRFDGGSEHSIGQSIGLAWFSAGINVVGIAKGWRGLIVWHLLSSLGSQEGYCWGEYGFQHS